MSEEHNEKTELHRGTIDELPPFIDKTLKHLEIRFEQIRFAVRSDVSSSGVFGEEWFVMTDAAVFTVADDGSVLHFIPYKNVLGIRAEVVIDAGVLVLESREGTVDLIRYSNGCAAKFGFVARFIGDEIEHRDGKRDEAPIWDYKVEEQVCASCGLPLPDEFSPCPACTKKHKVMLRILSYLRPYRTKAFLFIAFVISGTLISLVPPYFTRILIDDILVLTEDVAAAQAGSETQFDALFRSIQPVTTALAIAVGICSSR